MVLMPLVEENLRVWAEGLEEEAMSQARRTARLPIVTGHVSLMPDAHVGLGATIGSVVPTEGAVIPACVGVDIGCGMAAVLTDLRAADLPEDLSPLLHRIERAIPAGVGRGHDWGSHSPEAQRASAWLSRHRPHTTLNDRLEKKSRDQMGTLGAGNHFVEISLDEDDRVWAVLHSGSRGIGNQLAQSHIATAKIVAKRLDIELEDPDLAYVLEGTPEFESYLGDLLFAQAYARANRETMLDALLAALFRFVGHGRQLERINCHHNYTAQERHFGRMLWITRKGAISARRGEAGIIPGSMGTDTYLVTGKGNADAYSSSAHGAGRRMSRTRARKTLTASSLTEAMEGRTWLGNKASRLVDEHPLAYKDIDEVMRLSVDLVEVKHKLTAILNYKGT